MRRGLGVVAAAAVAMLALAGSAGATGINPPSKDFGDQTVGTSSAPALFTLVTSPAFCSSPDGLGGCLGYTAYSTDTSALGGDKGTTNTSGDFSIRNISCDYPAFSGAPIAFVSGICQFEVSFVPTSAGPKSQTLAFPETSGQNGSLTLTGNALATPATPATPVTTATPTGTPTHKRCKKKHRTASAAKKKCKKKR
jgi:hypothetical protein